MPSGEKITLVIASECPRRSGNIPRFNPDRFALLKLVLTKKQFIASTSVRSAPSKLVLWKSPFEMFALLILVWLKSFPLKLMLQPIRRVMEFDDRVIEFKSLSCLVAKIVFSSACSN